MDPKHSERIHPSDTYAISDTPQTRVEALEASLAHYAELYDAAPVGYATFSADCRVLEINLHGAGLAGVE